MPDALCYHCGQTEKHRAWCPDWGTRPDAGRVGEWAYSGQGLNLGEMFRRDNARQLDRQRG